MRPIAIGLALVILALCSLASATDWTSQGGFVWDVQDSNDGSVNNGSIDAYDLAYALTVNGTPYTSGGVGPSLNLDGRGSKMLEVTLGDLRVRRYIFVPKSSGDYVRYLDVIINLGVSVASVNLTLSGNLGSDSGTVLPATSTGDLTLDVSDIWFTTDDVDGGADPSLAHVIRGEHARVRPISIRLETDNFAWDYSTTVEPGARIAVLTYAVQAWSQAEAQAEARRLAERPADALVGVEAFVADIINY